MDLRPDVTALFAVDKVLAEAASQALLERGLRPPRDVSLVAYDHVAWMTMVSPKVTTVDQHTEEFGATCAQLLIERLAGRLPVEPVTRLVEPSLTNRGSSGAPARHRLPVRSSTG
jgi:LacI family transcriptional regulator